MNKGLIVDVGSHHGDDTRFYLSQGYDVLSVEANPELAQRQESKLAEYIAAGTLEVLNVAVADHEGQIDFYLSHEDLWASTRIDMADRGFGAVRDRITVTCTTLATLLANRPVAHYVKIDVEGQDANCLASLADLDTFPEFLSFEADLTDPTETHRMIGMVAGYGYRRFKLINQATHGADFSKHMSGPFGEDTLGAWLDVASIGMRFDQTVQRQAVRISYSATGKVHGIPLGWAHRPLMWSYNLSLVTRLRTGWATMRGTEVGGWFDIHCGR